MKALVVGPSQSPIIKKLVASLESKNVQVILASHDAKESSDVINLGSCKSMFSYLSFWKINRLVRKHEPDIVHAHILNHYGLMCLFQKKPLIVALWGSDVMLAPNRGSYVKRKLFRLVNWFVMKRADCLHTSGTHVAEEAIRQCSVAKNKLNTFYWGFPLQKPSSIITSEIRTKLKIEFNITKDDYYVFPRGLASVYNPEGVAKVINFLLTQGTPGRRIVVLRGFAKKIDVEHFSRLVDFKSIIFIDRLLNQDEMFVLYSGCKAHFSLPHSDSLGGGVIEPALLGSFPVLSDIPSYKEFLSKHNGYCLQAYSQHELIKLSIELAKLDAKTDRVGGATLQEDYSQEAVINKILTIYNRL